MADEHNNWAARRPAGEPHLHVQGETPEMAAVFAEVRDASPTPSPSASGPAADPDYMAAACIAIAREVGDKMLERRPIDTAGAADFAVTMILGGLQGPAQGCRPEPMAGPATQRLIAAQGCSACPTPMLRLMSGGGVVYQGGRTLDPAPPVPGRPGPRRRRR